METVEAGGRGSGEEVCFVRRWGNQIAERP